MKRIVILLLLLLAVPSGAQVRIVALGDSITKGTRRGVTSAETFPALLEARLGAQDIRAGVSNLGIGGERTDQALLRLDRDVIAKKPHVVTVMYGTNDSYVDAGKTASRITVESYRANLREITRRLAAREIAVVLMTPPRWGEEARQNGLGEDPNVRLEPFVEACRAVARETKTLLVDHYGHWAGVQKRGQRLQSWTTDACHPNPRGQEELAHRILQVLLPVAQRLADRLEAWNDAARFRVQLDTITRGYDGRMCWVHPRAGAIPGNPPSVVLTMQKLLLTGSDVFYALNDTRTDDLKTWSAITEHQAALGRREEEGGIEVGACDFWPKWHAKTGKLLGIGHTVRYRNNAVMPVRRRETCYAVYDPAARCWSKWTTLRMPDDPKFANAGAGCVQRLDLENGDILLPIYFHRPEEKDSRVSVLRCRFDGQTLTLVEQGNELAVAGGRGYGEPSLARCGNRYFLTLRNDFAGYVTTGSDGLHFAEPRKWTWTDGADLGNYNTQQHWVTRGDDLYLVYNRKGANNDHIMRHRAPLFMALVDREKLQLIRETERILVPERGARLGNFGVVDVGANETWVTVAEWMQTFNPPLIVPVDNPYGADNSVFAARIRWR